MSWIKGVSLILIIGICSLNMVACSSQKFTMKEEQCIQNANQIIEERYHVEINKDDYLYSVGKQISENEYISLDLDIDTEGKYEDIVVVSANIATVPKDDQILSFAVIFDNKSGEVIKDFVDE